MKKTTKRRAVATGCLDDGEWFVVMSQFYQASSLAFCIVLI